MNPKILVAAISIAICTPNALAHARLKLNGKLTPRNQNSGLKTGPCGGVAVDETKRVTLSAKETITVEWEETINHPGSYKISFATTEQSEFKLLKELQDTQDGAVTFNDPTTYHQYSTSIMVPDITCNKCLIQLIQVMTDRTPPTFYYSCADVKITGGSVTVHDSATTSTSNTSSTSTLIETSSETTKDNASESDKPTSPTNFKVKVNNKGNQPKLYNHDQTMIPGTSHGTPKGSVHDEETKP